MIAVVPGSFDPFTNGHLDVVMRAAAMFEQVVVAVGVNNAKSYLFEASERLELVRRAVDRLPRVRVEPLSGLLVDFCATLDSPLIVKGIRGGTDADYELAMARMNEQLAGVDTIWLPASARWAHVSSTLVRQIAQLGGDVSSFVPSVVAERLSERDRR